MATPLSCPTPTTRTPQSHSPFRNSNLFPFPSKPTSFITKSSSDPNPTPQSDPEPAPVSSPDDPFESRLAQIRLRYRSGTGKKAEIRKEKKGKKTSDPGSNTRTGGGVFLPPVPLKEPVSAGLKVEFGFSPYSERVNGRLAGLGLAALLLVELATGKSVISYHSPSIVFIQVYFMVAACAVFLKYEKEKESVWPFGDGSSTAGTE